MKTIKKPKVTKEYQKFIGIPAPMWFVFLLMTMIFGALSEYRLKKNYEARIAAYQEREDMYVKTMSQYRDSAQTYVDVMTETKYKIRELKERSDFYCDAYQSCMEFAENNERVQELKQQVRYIQQVAKKNKDSKYLSLVLQDIENAATSILKEK